MNTGKPGTRASRFDSEKLHRAIDSTYDQQSVAVKEKDPLSSFSDDSIVKNETVDPVAQQDQAKKREEMLAFLSTRLFSLKARFVFCLFILLLLIWIETAASLNFILPVYISLNSSVLGFLAADTLLLLLAGSLCGGSVIRGARSLFTFHPDSNSLSFVALLGAFINDIYLLLNSGSFLKDRMIYSSAAAAVLTLNLLGRLFDYRRARNGLRAMPKTGRFQSVKRLTPEKGVTRSEPETQSEPCLYPGTAVSMGDYISSAFSKTPGDRVAKVL